LYAGDPERPDAAICQRVESPKRIGEAGWLHVLRDDGPAWPRWRHSLPMMARAAAGPIDFDKLAADCRAAIQPRNLERLALGLGVSVESLVRLAVGWSVHHRAWSFPMVDAVGGVVGIRLRRPDGRKLAVKGGREGLFLPSGLAIGGRLLVTEGPTDCAALLDLGFQAVGRPSCMGGIKLLAELVRQQQPAELVVVADGDGPGQRGAENLAAVLVAYAAAVRVVAPPAGIKDAREWKRRGAPAADVLAAIDAAPVRRLAVQLRKAGAHHGK
jgi:hypothetical protein